MRSREKSFVFYLSGMEDNDAAAMNYIYSQRGYEDISCAVFKLNYTAPYQDFASIREFQYAMSYRPFADKALRRKVAIVDLSEWVGHENEEYIEIFCKFLHDFKSFFRYEYVFTAGTADKSKAKGLYRLISEYLCEGELVEDQTLTNSCALGNLLEETYPLDKSVAERLAEIFVAGHIKGLAQLHTVMDDFLRRMEVTEGQKVTEAQVMEAMCRLTDSKLVLLYENDMKKWQHEAGKSRDKERWEVA